MNMQPSQFERDADSRRISRRQWISGSTALGALMLSAARTDAQSADQKSQKKGYIDAHAHVWTPDTKSYPLDDRYEISAMQPPSFTAKELMRHAGESGVERVVLIQMSFYGFDNSYMLDSIAKHPGRFSGVAVIDPKDRPVETMKLLKAKGVRGFRIVSGKKPADTWLAGPEMRRMWGCAADEGMAICPLINPQYIASVDKMCGQFPDTRVVIDHFARVGVDGTIRQRDVDTLCRLARHQNTYVKTSAFYALGKKAVPYTDLGSMIQSLTHAFGSERLMWATDCPYQVQGDHTYHDSIDLIRHKLDFLTEEDRLWILQKTAEKVFFD